MHHKFKQSKRPYAKIDSQGQYCFFPGMSVISPLEDKEFARSIEHRLANDEYLTQHYAMLPSSSYHMTALNLFTLADEDVRCWPTVLLNRISQYCQGNLSQISARLDEVRVKGAIQLVLNLSHETQAQLKQVAEQFNLPNKLPKQFHITLAYQYQPLSKMAFMQIHQRVIQRLETLLAEHKEIKLHKPQVHYFEDMTAFYPYQAKHHPFVSHFADMKNRHLFYNKTNYASFNARANACLGDQEQKPTKCALQ